jgi:hypothetical protein
MDDELRVAAFAWVREQAGIRPLRCVPLITTPNADLPNDADSASAELLSST